MKAIKSINGLRIGPIQMPSIDNPLEAAQAFLKRARKLDQKGADIIVGSEMMLCWYLSGDRY